jgi:hypothetical protein
MLSDTIHIPDELFRRFAALEEACIDASSIIYLQKAGFFETVCRNLYLLTLPVILEEAGIAADNLQILQPAQPGLPPDEQVIQCVQERQCAVISEDKHILLAVKRANLPYYNALMMLNWLLFEELIEDPQYQTHYSALRTCARYSDKVWEYGAAVHRSIQNSRRKILS